ncbi:MAG: putative damage-inducible protein DinB [Rhodothermales bacterium]|jgi:uncharacterized damage-inducible protein DinB
MSTQTLVEHNITFLQQAVELVESLDDAAYTERRPPLFPSGIGDHLRHTIEHYQCFSAGLSTGRIDYDNRQRDESISSSPSHAVAIIEGVIDELGDVPDSDSRITVRLDSSSDEGDDDPWSESTVRRELQFLQAHTVHHYALIAFILRLQGTEPSARFGVAPSTLRHRKATGAESGVLPVNG